MKAFISDDRVRQSFLQTALQRPVNLAGQTGTTTDADSGKNLVAAFYRPYGRHVILFMHSCCPDSVMAHNLRYVGKYGFESHSGL